MLDDGQVMADEDRRDPGVPPDLDGEGAGDDDASQHAAGHLVRVLPDAPFRVGQADGVEEFDGAETGGTLVRAPVPRSCSTRKSPTRRTGLSAERGA